MSLEYDARVSLGATLTDISLAHRLVREVHDSTESSRERSRIALALSHIENVGRFLERLGRENNCLPRSNSRETPSGSTTFVSNIINAPVGSRMERAASQAQDQQPLRNGSTD